MRRLAVLLLVLSVAVMGGRSAGGKSAPPPVDFFYDDVRLILLLEAVQPETIDVAWQAISSRGALEGRRRSQRVEVKAGQNRVALAVGDAGAHRVTYRLAGEPREVWANRGMWYATHSGIKVGGAEHIRQRAEDQAPSDIWLGSGFRAETKKGTGPVEIGRTLGYDADLGLPLSGAVALVLVARGDVGPVMLTVSQRVGVKATQHWDYALVLSDRPVRHVVPLARFHPRLTPAAPLRSLSGVSLRSTAPAAGGRFLEVSHLGLSRHAPQLARMRRSPAGVQVTITSADGLTESALWVDQRGGARVRMPVRAASALVRDPEARRAWYCYKAQDGALGCDPPDAPATTYSLPPLRGQPVLIDGFDTEAPINAFREPTMGFASTVPLQQKLVERRRQGAFLVRFNPTDPAHYAGYLTPLPEGLPEGLLSLELTLRGKIPPEAVVVGLKDHLGREPRIHLSSYLDGLGPKWRTAVIPLEAFRAALAAIGRAPWRLGTLKRVSVTMQVSKTAAAHEIELHRVRFLPTRVPLAIARFDGEGPSETALRGNVLLEKRRGARISVRPDSEGKLGRAMSVTVSSVGGPAYALVSLGLGTVDARPYRSLSFFVRGAKGGESVAIYLGDGRQRPKVELGSLLEVSREWKKVVIPLARFGKRIALGELRQITLAWEDRAITEEKISFDEFFLE
jgi:hypothetical protein